MCKFRQMLHVRCQRGSDMTSLQIVSLWLPWWIDAIEWRRFCISARWSRADTTFPSSLQAWSFIRNVYSIPPFYKMIGATGGSQKSDPSVGGGAGQPDYIPSQVDSNYSFDIYCFCLFGWKKVAGVQRSVGVGMFCCNRNKSVCITMLLRSGNSIFLHDLCSQILSEFASTSYRLSIRQSHCRSRLSMQSLPNWKSLVPSSTSFPCMAQRY